MDREKKNEEEVQGRGPYEQTTLPPRGEYVDSFDEIPLGWPVVPCDTEICCCCLNAGIFETIRIREEPIPNPCSFVFSKGVNAEGNANFGGYGRRVMLGRAGWRVCLLMALFPLALPFRTCVQHHSIRDLYPVGSREESGILSRMKAALCFPVFLAKHAAFLSERQQAGDLRYAWQTRATWSVAERPLPALFKILVLGDHGVGKTALALALCGKIFRPKCTTGLEGRAGVVHWGSALTAWYTPGLAGYTPTAGYTSTLAGHPLLRGTPLPLQVQVMARSYYRHGHPPAVLEFWDVPASLTIMRQYVTSGASCTLLVFDVNDRITFQTTKRWHSYIVEGGRPSCAGIFPPPFIAIGTKIDVSPASHCSFLKEARDWFQGQGCPLLFCASFTGHGITSLLRQIVSACFQRHPPPEVPTNPSL